MNTLIEQNGKKWRVRRREKGGKRKTIKGGFDTKEEAEEFKKTWDKLQSLPEGSFDVIYADPPWRYDFSRSDSRSIENHYPTMELEDICNLPVPSSKSAILYLWATNPKLREALKVMEAWDFDYKTNFVWVKPEMGMGYHAIGRHELLLVGTKGDFPPPAVTARYQSVINASRGEHSKKPDLVYDIIEGAYPPTEHKLLELFARQKREGWTSWGNEL